MTTASPTAECVLWDGPLMRNGYPRRGRTLVHREVLATKLGRPVASGMDTCHTCDVRHCIAPDHLYEGDRRQNMADASIRGRLARPTGDRHWSTRITDDQVRELRRLYDGGWPAALLGRRFGIHPSYAREIAQGKKRKAVAA